MTLYNGVVALYFFKERRTYTVYACSTKSLSAYFLLSFSK